MTSPEDRPDVASDDLDEARRLLADRSPDDGWDDMHDPDSGDAKFLTDRDVE